MARVTGLYKPADYPADADETTKKDIKALFDYMCPGQSNPAIEPQEGGFAIVAQNPKLALELGKLAMYIAMEMPWCKRFELRELTVQTLNLFFKCDFSFQTHLPHAIENGVSAELQAAIPYWRTTSLFNDEQKLVIEYTFAVTGNDVSDELFARVVKQYGEKGAVEFTTAIAWWSFWAMILNATRPDHAEGH
jgi:hypothetical protein